MKSIAVFVAVFALAFAAPPEIRKDEKKPEEKLEEVRGLQWPLPDPRSEGDLMLHGSHFYDRVEELRKTKPENDVDKMILAFGRNFLRKAQKYLEANADFKIPPVLCRDSRELNSTRRWEIRIQPEHQPAGDKDQQQDQVNKERQEKQPGQGDREQKPENKPQSDAPAQETKSRQNQQTQNDAKDQKAKDDKVPATNATEFNVTEGPISTPRVTYEAQRADWYRRMGDNFARLLMKRYRKETLIAEENEYLDDWLDEEAIHYGVAGIYCHEGENVKEILKKIGTYVEEK